MHQPPELLHPQLLHGHLKPGVIGYICPPSARDHRFILAITNYISKWVKAIILAEVKTANVSKFIKHHVILRFGVP